MAGNSNLHDSAKNKQDEFYTRLQLIEDENGDGRVDLADVNPDQFEILGATESEGVGFSAGLWDADSGIAQPMMNGGSADKDEASLFALPALWH